MTERKKRGIAGDKTICLPLTEGTDYDELVDDTKAFRAYLDQMIDTHPEIFPQGIEQGYCFHGFVESGKLHLKTRRIRLKFNGEAYQLRPDTVMPYMIGATAEVEKGLYLRRYGVPYEGIAHVLGHSAMYWYHATQALGRASIVGSTVKDPDAIPPSPGGR
ncbi:hypothetical protein ACN4EG_27570 [Alkalinema pantanalense CENA528]|uniref:hypothetical protein n=1 Tax=Alkalinema pantanalense TaxID=1620705 RepID=UPI003D6E19D4